MMTVILALSVATPFLILQSLNPVKMSMMLLLFSSLVMIQMQQNMSSSWYAIIFYMLFMGGILIMFMILSSIMPNEKSIKLKKFPVILLFMFITMISSMMLENIFITGVKWLISSKSTMAMVLVCILAYFLSFLELIKNNKKPLQSIMLCW